MNNIKKYLLVILIVTCCKPVFCQIPFSEQNIKYIYDINSEFRFDHLVSFQEADSFEIDFTMLFNQPLDTSFEDIYSLRAIFKKDYKSMEILDSLALPVSQVLKSNSQKKYYFRYKGKNSEEAGLLELYVKNKIQNRDYIFDINLNEGFEYGHSGLIKYSGNDISPVLRNFIIKDTPLLVKSREQDSSNLWVYFYKTDFDIAVPPMIVDFRGGSKTLSLSKLFSVEANSPMRFAESGLYFIQKDTSTLEGIGFRVEEKPFPKMGAYEILIQPLKYISTKEEYDEFEAGENLGQLFENFWLEKSESEIAAKKSISDFYGRVAEANFFFTGYKEGWKTDLGMIYIIYGPPDRVFRHEEYEEWIYHQSINLPALRFTFVKIKNVFSDNHYTLVRDEKFDKHWFRAVELWRTGEK